VTHRTLGMCHVSSFKPFINRDPPRYAQHLTKEEVDAFSAPHADTVDAVDAWLDYHGIEPSHASTQRTTAGDWVALRITIEQAERMLNTKYNVYKHKTTGQEVVRTLSYSLPKELHSHIDVVAPTTYFGTLRSMRATSFLQPDIKPVEDLAAAGLLTPAATVPASCGTTVTVSCLRALYNTSSYVPAATSTNKLGVAGYLDEYANTADLQVSEIQCVRTNVHVDDHYFLDILQEIPN